MIKKAMIFTFMSLLSIFLFIPSVRAEVTEYTEEVTLTDSDYLINGSAVTNDSDYELDPDTYITVEFLISNILNDITVQDGYEVDSIELEVVFDMIRVAENINIYTYDQDLVHENNEYSTINGLFEVDRFLLYLDDTIDYSDFTYETTFYYTSDGSLVIPSINYTEVNIHYILSEDSFTDVIDVGTDFSLLPDTNGDFIDILSINEYDYTTHSHELTFAFGPDLYKFSLAIPEEIYDYEYTIPHENTTLSFRYFKASQMSFSTSPDGDSILYIQPNEDLENHPILLEDGSSPNIVGFSTINLTTMEYKIINKLELYGVVNKEDNRYASLYCFFPTFIEDLLSITVTYEYRINSILGIKGDWQTALNTYVRGDSYDGASPSWLWWIPAVGWGWIAGSAITGNAIYDIDNVIQSIDSRDIPDEVVNKYVTDLGGSTTDFPDLEFYKVSLGQYQDGFFTAFSDENAYDIQEFVILEVLYEYQGVVYEASADQISTNVYTPELSTGIFDGLFDGESSPLVWVGIGVVLVIAFKGFKLDKKPGLVVIIIAAIIWYLYTKGII